MSAPSLSEENERELDMPSTPRTSSARLFATLLLVPLTASAFVPYFSFSSQLFSSFVPASESSSCSPSSSSSSSSSQLLSSSSSETMATPRWYQKEITITAPSRGCHLITSDINKAMKDELSSIKIGMANLFIQHTSASLTINENADPDVR